MYYLLPKQFKLAMILIRIPFIPFVIGLIIANIILFKIELLIMLLIILTIYLTKVLILRNYQKEKGTIF